MCCKNRKNLLGLVLAAGMPAFFIPTTTEAIVVGSDTLVEIQMQMFMQNLESRMPFGEGATDVNTRVTLSGSGEGFLIIPNVSDLLSLNDGDPRATAYKLEINQCDMRRLREITLGVSRDSMFN